MCKTFVKETETLLKFIKEDPDKWRGMPCPRTRGLNILNMAVLPKLIYKFDASVIKSPVGFSRNLRLIPKCIYGRPNLKTNKQIKIKKKKQS